MRLWGQGLVKMQRSRWMPVFVGVAAMVFATFSHRALAQSSGSSDQLLGIFNGLSPEQQQQLLQQAGGARGGTAATGNARVGGAGAAATEISDEAKRRAMRAAMEGENLPAPGALRPGDTVLIEVEIKGTPAAEQMVRERERAQALASGNAAAINAASPVAPRQDAAIAAVPGAGAMPSVKRKDDTEQPVLTELERTKLKALVDKIRERNPYALDGNGILQLPGLTPFAVAGLEDELARRRVAADPALRNVELRLTRLPLTKSGVAGLKPFGYDYFDQTPSTFAPLGDVPVPADYIVGAGDELSVQLYGSQNRTLRLTVGRDGRVNLPEIGPITVAGRSFSTVRGEIEGRVSRQMIGTRASLSMGESRTIRVFVMGEAKYPGTYTVSGLATVTGALFAAGGVKPIGSLRNVQLKRAGKLVRTLDMYDLLLSGDTSNDVNLLSGDAILIPPVGSTVTVTGEVRRPAIYEVKGNVSVGEIVATAGGFATEADTSRAWLARVDDQRRRVVLEVDPSVTGNTAQSVRNGDVLRVAKLRPTLDSGVVLRGEIFRPGSFAWRPGLRLSEVIPSVDELKSGADQHYLLIRRESGPDRHISTLSADLTAALASPGGPADVPLNERDQITVFDLGASREQLVKPLLDELKLEATPATPAEIVSISGRVKAKGEYPLDSGMRVADLVRAGGGLDDAALAGKAELSRYTIDNGELRRTEVVNIDLAAALHHDPAANLVLRPFDGLYIKEISAWTEQEQVILEGEVRFPGTYPIKRGETLKSVIERAGGLTDLAFAEGAAFTREELRLREQEQLERLAERLRTDLASASMMASRANQGNAAQTYSIGENLLEQIKAAKAVGRLVINLPGVVSHPAGSADDIALRNGDRLVVPKQRQEVTVMGEVQTVTSHLYQHGRSKDDYIALSGGTTRQADRTKTYIVRADGSVVANNSGWLFRGREQTIKTGDTIVVPLNAERMPALPLWQSVTQILYNLTVAIAAVKTF
jgi:polysaccharide biosynthesis/export protein